jgi:rhomboid protease GlpG
MHATRQDPSMRQLATLPTADAARTLADHLQTLKIETRVDQEPGGWTVWVFDEDRLAQAKQELAEFTRNPADPRFAAARRAAEAMRRREEREEEERAAAATARAPAPPPARPGAWTYGLILTCCLMFVAHTAYLVRENAGLGFDGVAAILIWGSTKGQAVTTSPVEQALVIAPYEEVKQEDKIRWDYLNDILRGQVWRLVTPIFLHFGLVHLLFNMTMLWQLGAAVEVRRGAWRYLLFVLTCAIASNLAQYAVGGTHWENGPVIHASPLFGGMSGVLYGLFGYAWMKSRYEPELGLWVGPRTALWLIAWLFLCMTGAIGPVGNVAHVVGLLFGLLIGSAPHLWRLARGTRPT